MDSKDAFVRRNRKKKSKPNLKKGRTKQKAPYSSSMMTGINPTTTQMASRKKRLPREAIPVPKKSKN